MCRAEAAKDPLTGHLWLLNVPPQALPLCMGAGAACLAWQHMHVHFALGVWVMGGCAAGSVGNVLMWVMGVSTWNLGRIHAGGGSIGVTSKV